MPQLDAARRTILDRLAPLGPERVDLSGANGRVLAADVLARFDLPSFDNSAMDGFAVRAADCASGTVLPVSGRVAAGDSGEVELQPGSAVQILTGAPLPGGADTVVPFEETEALDGAIRLSRAPVNGDHVRRRGGDVRLGEVCLRAGAAIGPPEVAILAALGSTDVAVARRPVVAILSTGSELVESGQPLRPGAIYDCNGPMLAAAVDRAGGSARLLGIARDTAEELRERLAEGLSADILITSAGVSTGDRDYVREVLSELGAEELFWKVAIQPGRPFACAVVGRTCVFSLPGNPVAALLTFEVLVRPALRRLLGAHPSHERMARARLTEEALPRPDRTTLQRVVVERGEAGFEVSSSGRQATGFILTLARAEAIALIPPGPDPLPPGTLVDIQFLRAEHAMGEQA